jgi:recombination protein RecA
VGALTEFVGADCSGRISAALAYVAAITRTASVCAWIDAADSLDPESASANGIDLERLLWVRCGPPIRKPRQTVISSQNGVSLSEASVTPRNTGGGSPHPRSEGRDMPQAIAAMLHAHGGVYDRQTRRERKTVGTPGAPNRLLTHRSEQRDEQVNSDRLPPRRGDNLAIAPRCAEPQPRRVAFVPSGERMPVDPNPSRTMKAVFDKPWQAVDQALKVTDLLLQAGGFSAIVLDLGSIPPEIAWRIPLATWFRFRAACERTRVSLLLLTQHPCARSSAELVVRLEPGTMESENRVMTGIRYRVTTERSRSRTDSERVVAIRKPPQSEKPSQWKSEAAWARMK